MIVINSKHILASSKSWPRYCSNGPLGACCRLRDRRLLPPFSAPSDPPSSPVRACTRPLVTPTGIKRSPTWRMMIRRFARRVTAARTAANLASQSGRMWSSKNDWLKTGMDLARLTNSDNFRTISTETLLSSFVGRSRRHGGLYRGWSFVWIQPVRVLLLLFNAMISSLRKCGSRIPRCQYLHAREVVYRQSQSSLARSRGMPQARRRDG